VLVWQQLLLLLHRVLLAALHVLLWWCLLLMLRPRWRALRLLGLRARRTCQPPSALLGRRLLWLTALSCTTCLAAVVPAQPMAGSAADGGVVRYQAAAAAAGRTRHTLL
jgi:hypothetical protein